MSLLRGCLVVAGSLVLLGGYPAPRGPLAAEGKSEQEGAKPERKDLYGDPLPPGAVARMGTVRFRQPGCCLHVAYSPDGKLLASGGPEGIVIWDTATGKRMAFFQGLLAHDLGPGETNEILAAQCLAFSPDGRYLAAGFYRGKTHVWEVATGELFLPVSERYGPWNFVAFTADSRNVFTGDCCGIRLSEVATGKELWRQKTTADDRSLQPSGIRPAFGYKGLFPDGKTLAAVTHNINGEPALRLWDAASGKERHRFDGVTGRLAFGPDNTTLAVLGTETISLLAVATGKELRAWKWQSRGPRSLDGLAFSPDGKTLAAVGRLWDVATGKELRSIGYENNFIDDVSFSPDGKTLAVGSRDGIVDLWDVATGKQLHVFPAHRARVSAIAYSPDGRILASGDFDNTIRLWDAPTGKPLQCFGKQAHYFFTLAFSPDSRILASAGNHIVLWDAATGKELREFRGHEGNVPRVAFAPDGKTLVSGGTDKTLRLWEVATGKELQQFGHQEADVSAIVFSSEGKMVAFSGDRGTVWLWNVTTGKPMRTLQTPQSEPPATPRYRLAFSPDGSTLASMNSIDGAIRLWDVASGRQLREIEEHIVAREHLYRVNSLTFSPDGKCLASADYDGTIRLWEVLTGKERLRLNEKAYEVAFSPDGKVLAATNNSMAVLAWDVTGRLQDGKIRVVDLRPKEMESLWADLASEDGTRAWQALWTLAAAPGQALPFLKERLQAVPPIEPGKLARLIDDLDSEQFNIRERASKELEKLGEAVKPALLHALKDQTKPERRRRAEHLLTMLERPLPPERLRILRAIEVLEHVASPEASTMLEKLAKGAPGALETEHARAALQRLHRLTSN